MLISEVFIRIFKCISLPIIALSVIVTLSQYRADVMMKRIWHKTLFYTVTTTIVAAAVALVLYKLISPDNILHQPTMGPNIAPSGSSGNYLSFLINSIPTNIFAPFIEHQVMGVLLISIIGGLAIRNLPDEDARNSISRFFKGAHGIFLIVTGWVVNVIPLALFGFIVATISQLKSGADLSGLGGYLTVILLSNLIQGFVILPLYLYTNGVNPIKAFKGMLPALSVAFFSKSSTGALPVTIASAENNLDVNQKVSRFVLPLCTSINMNGCAAFIFTTVIFLMQNHGIKTGLLTMIMWIFISTIAAIGNAGVPMGCFFLSASLLTSMNVPIALLGLILPFYNIIDMIETALNVWSDSCIAKIIHEQTKGEAKK